MHGECGGTGFSHCCDGPTEQPGLRIIKMGQYAIWWTSDTACNEAKHLMGPLPKYIKDELISRCGRAGRGRLWINDEVKDAYPNGISKIEAPAECGGIVIHRHDFVKLKNLPGFITYPD